MTVRPAPTLVLLVVALAACADDDGDSAATPSTTRAIGSTTIARATSTSTATTTTASTTSSASERFDAALHAELLAMFEADQQERTGEGLPPGTKLPPSRDDTRAQRLKEIIAEHGWPTWELVGVDGGTAAWVVVQHADFDPEFQSDVVDLMRAAVDAGQADPIELAYLEDRVLVNTGEPQRWGTQVRCRDGVPAPATPIADEGALDERRTALGLEPLADYYAELAMMCADEEAEGEGPAG